MSWDQPFDAPIILPSGKALANLRDAGAYVASLPKKDTATPEWQTAMQALLLAADMHSPVMHARIAMMKALSR